MPVRHPIDANDLCLLVQRIGSRPFSSSASDTNCLLLGFPACPLFDFSFPCLVNGRGLPSCLLVIAFVVSALLRSSLVIDVNRYPYPHPPTSRTEGHRNSSHPRTLNHTTTGHHRITTLTAQCELFMLDLPSSLRLHDPANPNLQ